MVVTLKQQVRVIDPVWNDFLRHLRHGQVQLRHIVILENLCLTNPACPRPDFNQEPWNAVVLVTLRHGVCTEWNAYALHKHCVNSGQQLFIVRAEHQTAPNHCLNFVEADTLCCHTYRPQTDSNELPLTLEVAIGMPVLVTHNLRTELDIMNGTRGFITNIILHPAEPPPSQTKPTVELHHLPLFILVKLNQTHAPCFGSEDEAVVLISPIQMSIRLHLSQNSKNVVRTIT